MTPHHKQNMDVVSSLVSPKNGLFASAVVAGALIAFGLIANNSNTQNKTGLSPIAIDTTAIGPFSPAEIKAMWEQWRLDAQWSGNGSISWAPNHVFNYCYNQFPIGGNVLQANDPILSLFGFSDIATFTNTYGSGYYIVVVSTNSTNNFEYATLFHVVPNINTNATTVPNNTVTTPHTYRLSYVNVIDNIVGGQARF